MCFSNQLLEEDCYQVFSLNKTKTVLFLQLPDEDITFDEPDLYKVIKQVACIMQSCGGEALVNKVYEYLQELKPISAIASHPRSQFQNKATSAGKTRKQLDSLDNFTAIKLSMCPLEPQSGSPNVMMNSSIATVNAPSNASTN